jgi:hypothetical protein
LAFSATPKSIAPNKHKKLVGRETADPINYGSNLKEFVLSAC